MQAEIIELTINKFLIDLAQYKATIPQDCIDRFAEKVRKSVMTDATRSNNGEFTLRLSSLGRPICQLQMEKMGVEQRDVNAHTLSTKFAIGDMLEHWVLMIMEAAGVPIDAEDIPCKLKVSGAEINGTADVIIDGKLYDIKTASKFAFNNKWTQGFDYVVSDDPFGYLCQGYGYSEALGVPFGGWIVVCKDNSEITICEAPDNDEPYRSDALRRMEKAFTVLTGTAPFKREFKDIEEIFKKVKTGNRVLGTTCEWCSWKHACWENLDFRPSIPSQAKDPKWVYYTHIET